MERRKWTGVAIVASCIALTGALVACAPQAKESGSGANASASEEAADGLEYGKGGPMRPGWITGGLNDADSAATLEAYQDARVQREIDAVTEYAPEVKTLEDGTQIQKTPQDDRFWNVAALDADNRGCVSCHPLEDAIENTSISHASIQTVGTTELNVFACKGCHTDLRANLWGDNIPLSDAVHTTHLRSDYFDGDCFSCHEQDANGEWQLWEEVKWDVLRGTTAVESVAGEFSFDQDVVLPLEDSFYRGTDNTVPGGTLLGGDVELDLFSDEFYNNYTIKVEGEVNNPFEISVANPQEELVTRILKQRCEIDGPDSGLISNFEVTGIDFRDIIEKADLKDTANGLHFKMIDEAGYNVTFPLDWVLSDDNALAMLGLQINGEKLTAGHGFPATMFWGNYSCEPNLRHILSIEFVHVDDEADFFIPPRYAQHGVHAVDDEEAPLYSPAVAVVNTYDGQIFQAGDVDTLSFEGYADAYDEPIAAVEFSLDGGLTWDRHETPGTTAERWVYWYYDIPAPAPGSYVLTMRAETVSGYVSPMESHLLFHIQ